jgi:hypothetical protein
MFNPSREQVRQFFFDAWRKYRQAEQMTALEGMALQVMLAHPEYHAVLNDPENFLEQEYFPEMGETNPFLHMSLHLSVLEQLSIDQPPGIAAAYQRLVSRLGEHPAQHVVLDCLAETVWQAQRNETPPDAVAYLERLQLAAK